MPTFAQRVLQHLLRPLAVRTLRRYHPTVIGVTGSVGKTSTVLACALMLGAKRRVRASAKNYNNEIGVPLSVLGLMSGGRSGWRWLGRLWRGVRVAFGPAVDFPQDLILELASDKPGDLQYLTTMLHPRIGIVTGVTAAHLNRFESLAAVAEEKGVVVAAVPSDGVVILNADDPLVTAMRTRTKARVITYGLGPRADVSATQIGFIGRRGVGGELGRSLGLCCRVKYGDAAVSLELPHVVGEHMLYAVLAAVALGLSYGRTLAEVVPPLSAFMPPPGRMRVILGIKRTTIIDGSYNSSPFATQAAVRTLTQLPVGTGRRYAVLGDMLELGAIAGRAHRELGGQVARAKLDGLFCVGELARDIARGAQQAGFPEEKVFTFSDAGTAGRFLQDRIHPGDVLLVKGSQAVRLERLVKELMAEPLRARELLVRQGPEW
ncbi:MAG: UDP-N-acetylmuramoyl-tripeptide--D-alanyl-D-alanine ligase [Patescibacteria group bacterium]|nr:UDP-N-acetylmuramoyl-tripeptide--D-alanyl-D-alanine ligase [Patescibacteria group bacterium]